MLNFLYKDPLRKIKVVFVKKSVKESFEYFGKHDNEYDDDDDGDGCGGVSGSSMTDPSLKHFPYAPPYI